MTLADKINIIVLIVNSVAALVAIIAAIVAIRGNKEAKKQFEENMSIQKRSLNLSLFDERMAIYEKIKIRNFKFSRDRAGFLFDDRIISLILQYDRISKKLHNCESAQTKVFDSLIDQMSANENKGRQSPNFPNLRYIYSFYGNNAEITEEEYNFAKEILANNPQKIDLNGERQIVSYVDMDKMIKEYSSGLKNIHKTLVNEMKSFIDLSLSDGEKYLK